jgi:hypothetical protein
MAMTALEIAIEVDHCFNGVTEVEVSVVVA